MGSLERMDRLLAQRHQLIAGFEARLVRGRPGPDLGDLNGKGVPLAGFLEGHAQDSLGLFQVFGLFAQKHGGQLHGGAQHVHGLDFGGSLAVGRIFGHERFLGFVVQPGPGHAVAAGVELHLEPSEYGEPQNAIDGGPRKPQGVHPLKLERVFHPGLEVGQLDAPFQVEPIHGRPEFTSLGVQANLLGHGRANEQGGGPGIHQEVERPLAIDPGPHQVVVGERAAVGNRKRLANLGIPGGGRRLLGLGGWGLIQNQGQSQHCQNQCAGTNWELPVHEALTIKGGGCRAFRECTQPPWLKAQPRHLFSVLIPLASGNRQVAVRCLEFQGS